LDKAQRKTIFRQIIMQNLSELIELWNQQPLPTQIATVTVPLIGAVVILKTIVKPLYKVIELPFRGLNHLVTAPSRIKAKKKRIEKAKVYDQSIRNNTINCHITSIARNQNVTYLHNETLCSILSFICEEEGKHLIDLDLSSEELTNLENAIYGYFPSYSSKADALTIIHNTFNQKRFIEKTKGI
jgi:hypothetical protein